MWRCDMLLAWARTDDGLHPCGVHGCLAFGELRLAQRCDRGLNVVAASGTACPSLVATSAAAVGCVRRAVARVRCHLSGWKVWIRLTAKGAQTPFAPSREFVFDRLAFEIEANRSRGECEGTGTDISRTLCFTSCGELFARSLSPFFTAAEREDYFGS